MYKNLNPFLKSLDEAYLVPTCEGSSSFSETYLITKGSGYVTVSAHYNECELGIVKMRISPDDEYCNHNDPSDNNNDVSILFIETSAVARFTAVVVFPTPPF